jgi:ABC-type enterochelin transport system permease subunit
MGIDKLSRQDYIRVLTYELTLKTIGIRKRNTMANNFYTAHWSNIVSIALGIVAAIYAIVVLIIGVGTTGFIGLVVIGGIT